MKLKNKNSNGNPIARILLVEDNEYNANMLSRRLKKSNYAVEVAIDGQQAIDKAIELIPDIILMDLSLPVLDGWSATRIIKANDTTSHIPIIALTAHSLMDDYHKAINAVNATHLQHFRKDYVCSQ